MLERLRNGHAAPPPDLPPAWYRGREDFYAGRTLADCPYGEGTADHASWTAAFRAAEEFRRALDEHLDREA